MSKHTSSLKLEASSAQTLRMDFIVKCSELIKSILELFMGEKGQGHLKDYFKVNSNNFSHVPFTSRRVFLLL